MSPFWTTVLKHGELRDLLFGQQTIGTQGFFEERFGQYHTIRLQDLPHYDFLCNHLDDPFSDHIYAQYLTRSWDYYYGKERNTAERRRRKIEKYVDLYREIEGRRHLKEKAFKKPILLCRRPDGRVLIISGNHRAAVALKLGLDLRATFLPPIEHLSDVIAVPEEFYGTKRLNQPYQSIFYQGKELIKGRRRDIQERMQRLDEADLKGRTVLDLG